MTSFKGVILDIDGTLIDSNHAHTESWRRALEAEGLHFAYIAVRRMIGMGGDKLLPTIAAIDEESEQGKRISQRRAEIFKKELLPGLKAFPGAADLLRQMRAQGLRLAVATSGKREDLEALLRVTGLDALLGAKESGTPQVSGTDVEESKPEPDLVEGALKELGLAPEECVMLGDTPYDIHAAKMARVKTIAFRCGGWDTRGLQGALEVYDGPADLLARWDESPFVADGARRAA